MKTGARTFSWSHTLRHFPSLNRKGRQHSPAQNWMKIGLLAAGGRDNPVHPEIFDHLAVMVHHMADDEGCHTETRCLALAEGAVDWGRDQVFVVDGAHSLMEVGEWIFGELHDLVLVLDCIGAVFTTCVDRRFLAANACANHLIDRRHMLDLLSEGADALKLAIGRSKSVFILGHRLGRGDELPFDAGQAAIEYLAS